MKANFKELEVENIDGSIEKVDLSKVIGNTIYGTAKTLEEAELARNIWKEGEVELSKEDVEIVKKSCENFIYCVKQAILKQVE